MPLTVWILGVAALAGGGYWLRRQHQRSRQSARKADAHRKSAAEQADLDRRDCKALEASLRTGAYAERSATGGPRPEA